MVDKTLFTLFHHDVDYNNQSLNFNTSNLLNCVQSDKLSVMSYKEIADVIYNIVLSNVGSLTDKDIALTLTGGMDSRVILACLLKAGIKPKCLTFGNPQAVDVVISKQIAKYFGLDHYNPSSISPTSDWYYYWVRKTIEIDKGNSHLHRAHRTAAIAEYVEHNPVKLLFTGHMGGEGLRGLAYNNYFSSKFFENCTEDIACNCDNFNEILTNYFVREDNIDYLKYEHKINNLPWMRNKDKEINKLFFIYDLVGKIHHSQDLRIYNHYVPNVVPVYLQNEYLVKVFSSNFNFLSKNKSLFGQLNNPKFYCKTIEYLYPELLDLPFSNKFTPREYLRGLWYYVPAKIYRDIKRKGSNPPTFAYGQWYIDFVKEYSSNISDHIWEYYDKDRYMTALNTCTHERTEGYWHKFSNPIYFDLINKLVR